MTPRPAAEAVDVLDGVDPVLLLQGKEIVGKENLAVVRRGYRYLFATPETKAEFEKYPSRYEPAYGGTCARMGARTGASPQLFAVHEGRIYLFGSDDCIRLFKEAPAKYVALTAAAPSYSKADLARGAELLEQAARAVGGGARLDALKGWRIERLRWQPSPNGPVTYSELTTVILPDRVRHERRAPFGTVITVDAPADAFGIFIRPDGTVFADERPLAQREALAADVKREQARELLGLLRARRAAGVILAATSTARAGEPPAASVVVRSALAHVTLGVDPRNGRILSEAYRDRGPDGSFGEILLEFSDYREVDGLSLPFAAHASFDGQPAPRLGYTVKEWKLDPDVDASLFARPLPSSRGAGGGH